MVDALFSMACRKLVNVSTILLETSNFLTGSYGCSVLVNLLWGYVWVRREFHSPERICLMKELMQKSALNLNPYFAAVKCNRGVLGETVLFFPNECKLLTNHLVFTSTGRERKKPIFK